MTFFWSAMLYVIWLALAMPASKRRSLLVGGELNWWGGLWAGMAPLGIAVASPYYPWNFVAYIAAAVPIGIYMTVLDVRFWKARQRPPPPA